MHGNDENMLFWSQYKFRITFQLQFLEWFFFFYFIYNFGIKIDIKTKKNKRNYFNFVLYYQIIRIVYVCVKTEEEKNFYCISWKFYTKMVSKVAKIWKTCLLFYGCHGNGDDVIILIMISNDLQ